MEIKKTGFEWCLQEFIRPDISDWPTTWTFYTDSFYNERITYLDFFERIKTCTYQKGTPVKGINNLELRMYGLVPYNISPIQQAIQYGHAVVEYGQLIKLQSNQEHRETYNKWAEKDKTFIILNGGTTNENPEKLGTLQQHLQTLKDNGVFVAEFREPDLNDTLTAITFLVDERVFNKTLYPDHVPYIQVLENGLTLQPEPPYDEWVREIGGKKNEFLRVFLSKFKLA